MFSLLAIIIDFLTDIFVMLFFIIINTYLHYKYKKLKNKDTKILYNIYSKNYLNIFLLIFSLCYICFFGINIYKNIQQNITPNIGLVEPIIFIFLGIILFFITLFLMFKKSIIINDYILLNNGIFNINSIKGIEKGNKDLKIYIKKPTLFAAFGYKKFNVKDKDIDEIYNYIKDKIV